MIQYPLLGPRDPESMGCRRMGRGILLILLGIAALVFAVLQGRTSRAQRDLVERGTAVTGIVSKIYEQRRSTLKVCYSFPMNDTTVWIEDRRALSGEGLRPGDSIPVWYDPKDPQRCVSGAELRVGGGASSTATGIGVGALMILLGVLSIGWVLKRDGRPILST